MIILELQNFLFHDEFLLNLYVIMIIREYERSASLPSKLWYAWCRIRKVDKKRIREMRGRDFPGHRQTFAHADTSRFPALLATSCHKCTPTSTNISPSCDRDSIQPQLTHHFSNTWKSSWPSKLSCRTWRPDRPIMPYFNFHLLQHWWIEPATG
jgi:hypothetical protein